VARYMPIIADKHRADNGTPTVTSVARHTIPRRVHDRRDHPAGPIDTSLRPSFRLSRAGGSTAVPVDRGDDGRGVGGGDRGTGGA
jgi:hypothetical protein